MDTKEDSMEAAVQAVQTDDEITAAEAWSRAHGSQRLRKIADAGLMAQAMSVYREERLAVDMPGWILDSAKLERAMNPSEEAVDAYTEARGLHGDGVFLMYHPERRCQVIRADYDGRQVIRAAVPKCGYSTCTLPQGHGMGGAVSPRSSADCTKNPQKAHAAWVARLPQKKGG